MRPRWLSDLLLGARLGLAGGREGWLRTALTAIGVGLGVAILLLAASVPNILAGPDARAAARAVPSSSGPPIPAAENTLLVFPRDLVFRDALVRGYELRPEGAAAPVPPGLTALPGPGELVVSPALADLLASPDGPLLAPRLNYPVVGLIGEDGLRDPAELIYYLGSDDLDDDTALRIDHFGDSPAEAGRSNSLLSLVLVAGLVVLLLPVATFIAVAARFGGEQRDRRLAAVRLVGADAAMIRRVAAGEALLGALAGVLAGWLFFLVGREFVDEVSIQRIRVFTADVRPTATLTVAIISAAPALAVAVLLLGQRRLTVEPLGLVRRTTGRPRRLWWRLVLPVIGVGVLAPLLGGEYGAETVEQYQLAGGVLLVLLGVVALLPWLVEAVVRRIGGGPVAWLLATRRLQLSVGTTGRVVSGVAVAVTGMVALQMLLTAAESTFVKETGADPDRPRAVATIVPARGEDENMPTTETVAARFAATTGVRTAHAISWTRIVPPDDVELNDLVVGDCAALRELLEIGDCRDGDVFLDYDAAAGAAPAPPEEPLVLSADGGERTWTVPAAARAAASAHPLLPLRQTIAATPAAVADLPPSPYALGVLLELDPAEPDALEHARNTVAAFDPYSMLSWERAYVVDEQFDSLRRWLFAGVTATLLLIGLSLLVGTVEQLRERRRALAALAAYGTPRATMGWSVLWQTAVPVLLGLVLATATGAGLGTLLLRTVDQPASVDWAGVLRLAGAGAAVVLLSTALSLPALWRLMRSDKLRTE